MFPGEIPGGVALNSWRGGAAQTAFLGKADDRFVTKLNHFYNGDFSMEVSGQRIGSVDPLLTA